MPERLLRWSIRANNLTLQMPAVRTLTEKRGGDWGAGIVYSTLLKRANLRMNRSGVVYIAAINGAAIGGGFEMALACDLRFAADDERVQIGLIEILAGLIPGGGGIRRLTDIIGQAKAFEHMVEGRPLSAREAHSAGLIHGVSDPDVLIADTYRTAERLACRSPHAVAALKRSVYFNGRRRLSAAIDAELAAFVATGRNPRKREIATAFEADLDRLGDSPFAVDIEPWLHGTRRADGR